VFCCTAPARGFVRAVASGHRHRRPGAPLRLTGHPLNAATPVVRSSWSAGSSPGNIYPSDIEVPAPGCWRFTLAWHRHTDAVDLWYVRHR
jgi:hypothetical protein